MNSLVLFYTLENQGGFRIMTIKGTQRTLPPFRAELVGSFLRPEAIKVARLAFNEGPVYSILIINGDAFEKLTHLV